MPERHPSGVPDRLQMLSDREGPPLIFGAAGEGKGRTPNGEGVKGSVEAIDGAAFRYILRIWGYTSQSLPFDWLRVSLGKGCIDRVSALVY